MKLLNIIVVRPEYLGSTADIGVYVLGKLWMEGEADAVYEELLRKHVVHISEVIYADFDWYVDGDNYPYTLSEVKRATVADD